MWTKQLNNRKVRDFGMASRARKVSEAFEKLAPEDHSNSKKKANLHNIEIIVNEQNSNQNSRLY